MTREKLKQYITALEAVKRDLEKDRIALDKNKASDPREKAILKALERGVSGILRECRLKESFYTIT